jgi:hypothetical protein
MKTILYALLGIALLALLALFAEAVVFHITDNIADHGEVTARPFENAK